MKSSMQPPVVIRDPEQLRSFAASRAFISKRPLVLELDGIDDPFATGERLNRDRGECGCALGARMMTLAFVTAVLLLVVAYGPLTLALLEHLPLAFAAAIAFALVGKAAGIVLGRRRARTGVARLLKAIS